MQCDGKIVQQLWLTLVLFSLHQMTPLHLAVESNRFKMVESLLGQAADIINLQDENEVIFNTNAVDYFRLAGRCLTYCSFSLLFEHKVLILQASKLDSDLKLGWLPL